MGSAHILTKIYRKQRWNLCTYIRIKLSESRYNIIYISAGPAYFVLHPQNDITICVSFLTYQAFKNLEPFLRQILLSDLKFDTHEWKQTKIWMIFQLKCGGVLILKCVVCFILITIW